MVVVGGVQATEEMAAWAESSAHVPLSSATQSDTDPISLVKGLSKRPDTYPLQSQYIKGHVSKKQSISSLHWYRNLLADLQASESPASAIILKQMLLSYTKIYNLIFKNHILILNPKYPKTHWPHWNQTEGILTFSGTSQGNLNDTFLSY